MFWGLWEYLVILFFSKCFLWVLFLLSVCLFVCGNSGIFKNSAAASSCQNVPSASSSLVLIVGLLSFPLCPSSSAISYTPLLPLLIETLLPRRLYKQTAGSGTRQTGFRFLPHCSRIFATSLPGSLSFLISRAGMRNYIRYFTQSPELESLGHSSSLFPGSCL